MNRLLTLSEPIRLPAIRLIPLHECLVVLLFLFYLLYPDLGISGIIPFYDRLEDLLLILMLFLTALKFLNRSVKIPLPPIMVFLIFWILIIPAASMLVNSSDPILALKYIFTISRPFILLLFLLYYRVNIPRVVQVITNISWVLLIYCLPAIFRSIAVYNLKILTAEYNDVVVGMFPFHHNDLVIVYVILLTKVFYEALYKRNKKQWLLVGFLYFILVTSMNEKVIVLVSAIFLLLVIIRNRAMWQNFLIFLAIVSIPAVLVLPRTLYRMKDMIGNPALQMQTMVLSGKIEEYDYLFGTGPGTLTSKLAFDNQSPLAEKYGILETVNFWKNYVGVTGTLTSFNSSSLALIGDCGVLIVGLELLLLLYILQRLLRLTPRDRVYLLGMTTAFYSLVIGFFMNTWFWGSENFFMILAIAMAVLEKNASKVFSSHARNQEFDKA